MCSWVRLRLAECCQTLRGIDEQVAKAEKAVAGTVPVKRKRFIRLDSASKTVNRELEAKTRELAGIKGHHTNLQACPRRHPRHRRVRVTSPSSALVVS